MTRPPPAKNGIGQHPHQPDPAAAEHQLDARRRQALAEIAGGVAITLVDRPGRTAIDAYPAISCVRSSGRYRVIPYPPVCGIASAAGRE